MYSLLRSPIHASEHLFGLCLSHQTTPVIDMITYTASLVLESPVPVSCEYAMKLTSHLTDMDPWGVNR